MTWCSAGRSSPVGPLSQAASLPPLQVLDPSVGLANCSCCTSSAASCATTHCSQLHFRSGLHTQKPVPAMQVFDLQEFRPGQVLQQIYKNFEDAERRGDPLAASFKRSAFAMGGRTSRLFPSKHSWACTSLSTAKHNLWWCTVHSAAHPNISLLWCRTEAHTWGSGSEALRPASIGVSAGSRQQQGALWGPATNQALA